MGSAIIILIVVLVLNSFIWVMSGKPFKFEDILNYLYYNFVSIIEMCDDKWITANISGLRHDLQKYVYGQPFLLPIVVPALQAIVNKNYKSNKSLVLYFSGMSGTGKSFVADMIARNFYLKGANSKFIKVFDGVEQFHVKNQQSYMSELKEDLLWQIGKCPRSLFIFDSIDELPEGSLDFLSPLLDYNKQLKNNVFGQSVFILLSNAGSKEIFDMCVRLIGSKIKREDYKIKDFEPMLKNISYMSAGGLKHSSLIDHNLIDYYIPFLPLEREHVRMCIKDEAMRQGVPLTDNLVREVMDLLIFIPESEKVFSAAGCKNIASKVGYAAFNVMPEMYRYKVDL